MKLETALIEIAYKVKKLNEIDDFKNLLSELRIVFKFDDSDLQYYRWFCERYLEVLSIESNDFVDMFFDDTFGRITPLDHLLDEEFYLYMLIGLMIKTTKKFNDSTRIS